MRSSHTAAMLARLSGRLEFRFSPHAKYEREETVSRAWQFAVARKRARKRLVIGAIDYDNLIPLSVDCHGMRQGAAAESSPPQSVFVSL
jgi:hypothetical protein